MPDSPELVTVALAALAGLLIGSFLNVCIYRVMRDLSVVSPRSFCPQCEKQIAWYDNLPLLSFLLLRGRCRTCSHRIGWRYPLVEALTSFVFAVVMYRYGVTWAALKWVLFESLMVVLFWTDFEERLLPDEFTLGGALAGIAFAVFVPVPSAIGSLALADYSIRWQSLFSITCGTVLITGPIWLAGYLWEKISHRPALGFGDVKLLVLLGVFLGLDRGILALQIGCISGAVLGLLYILLTRKNFRTYEVPLGCYLCAAGAAVPLLQHAGTSVTGS